MMVASCSWWLGAALSNPTALGGYADDHKWYSQYGQDRFIMENYFAADLAQARSSTGKPRSGFFIELGAADGLDKSNTLAFEKQLGWKGLLIEASDDLFSKLKNNRPNAMCIHSCVTSRAGEYRFTEDGYSSGLTDFRGALEEGQMRHCKSLNDIIDKHMDPGTTIDYLSLDMEGGELEILSSFDFARHPIDVISIEVHEWREKLRARRIRRLLEARQFRFVERIVHDEIYIRKRGFLPDPSCIHPSVRLIRKEYELGPYGGWSRVRGALRDLWGKLDNVLQEDRYAVFSGISGNSSLVEMLAMQDTGDPALWEAQCPVGMLTSSLATTLLRNRPTSEILHGTGVAEELQSHIALHPNVRMQQFADAFADGYQDEVEKTERMGEKFEVRFPLGRAWHELSFVDTVKSGWPTFGFLDLMARLVNATGNMFKRIPMQGEEYYFPMMVPRLMCSLEESDGAGGARLAIKQQEDVRSPRGNYAASSDMSFDIDACGLMGIAAVRFLAAREEIRTQLAKSPADVFVPLANWSAACYTRSDLRRPCSAERMSSCSAVAGRSHHVTPRCMALRENYGASLRLRRSSVLAGWTRAALLIEEGERLLREFVKRHGLYAAIWVSIQPEFTTLRKDESQHTRLKSQAKKRDGAKIFGDKVREGMFSVMHSLQEMVLASEELV